jgi:hypothetical protein
MQFTKYFRNAKLRCRPWDSIHDDFERRNLVVQPEFSLSYSDAVVAIKARQELRDVLASKGEPQRYSARVRVGQLNADVLMPDRPRDILWIDLPNSDGHQISVTGLETKTIDETFVLLSNGLHLELCHRDETSIALRQKIVFIAHAFDDRGYGYGRRLEELFDCLGFDVRSGSSFAPTDVAAKISERMTQAKLVVTIATPQADMTWVTQEAAIASRDKPLIMLVEKGVDWKPGIHGTTEIISFPPNSIEQAFIPLMRGLDDLRFLESFKTKARLAVSQSVV